MEEIIKSLQEEKTNNHSAYKYVRKILAYIRLYMLCVKSCTTYMKSLREKAF